MEHTDFTPRDVLDDGYSGNRKWVVIVGKAKNVFLNNLLLCSTVIGVGFGFTLGFAVRETHPSENGLMWLGLPGQLYLRLLKMMIVPLIVCSVISGAAALEPKANGKISLLAFVFIVCMNAIGSALGIAVVCIFNPGKDDIRYYGTGVDETMHTEDILADLIRNIIPDNLFESTFAQTQTMYDVKESVKEINTTRGLRNETVKTVTKYLEKSGGANVIGLIFACTLLGLGAASMKEKGKLFVAVVQSISISVIAVMRWCLWTTPLGVVSLIGASIAGTEDVADVFAKLGVFIAAVTVGIIFQQLVLMTGIYFVFTRRNPFQHLISITRPWMIAFASTTTAVAIPEMLTSCEDKNNMDTRITRFVIPFSVTINRSGSALYIAGATVFVANLTGTELNIVDLLLIWLLVSVAAMAIPAIPSASIMTTLMVLTSMNIPVDDVVMLIAVEWYLDRLRSTGNIVSHTVCAAVVWQLCRKNLAEIDEVQVYNSTGNATAKNERDHAIIIERETTQ